MVLWSKREAYFVRCMRFSTGDSCLSRYWNSRKGAEIHSFHPLWWRCPAVYGCRVKRKLCIRCITYRAMSHPHPHGIPKKAKVGLRVFFRVTTLFLMGMLRLFALHRRRQRHSVVRSSISPLQTPTLLPPLRLVHPCMRLHVYVCMCSGSNTDGQHLKSSHALAFSKKCN